MTEISVETEDAQIERLVLKGLTEPLCAADAAVLDAWASAAPERLTRIAAWTQAWMMAGIVDRRRVERASLGSASFGDGPRRAGVSRRWMVSGGASAALAAAVVLAVQTYTPTRTYVAPDDAPLKVRLDDGTMVVLSRGGRIDVRLDHRRRDVTHLQGEVFYDVAKDKTRPFHVAVGEHRLAVLGTRFNVDPRPGGLRVDLLEGSLRVEPIAGGQASILRPGERFEQGTSPQVAQAQVENIAAWVDGRLVFDNQTLTEVATRIARHAGRRLIFADQRAAALRFSGVLRVDDDMTWKAALEAVLPVRIKRRGDGAYLVTATGS